eukprot:TRINITY_DN4116_c0_g1_i1.p1 TRINITY_DN4116_c0_g1~~TRINITY_DN4116_c0_g1_i1.p1  ORF type:complete len:303 (+),score=55.89 TRINITY_DN4116_c0_g1_i1:35-943(+)
MAMAPAGYDFEQQQQQQQRSRLAQSTPSRSTSAGSSGSCSDKLRQQRSEERAQLPDIIYPVPVEVRNTFVNVEVGRDPSLEEFFQERQARSCPGSPALPLLLPHDADMKVPVPPSRVVSQTPPPEDHPSPFSATLSAWLPFWSDSQAPVLPAPPTEKPQVLEHAMQVQEQFRQPHLSSQVTPSPEALYTRQPLCLEQTLHAPELGTGELPSKGSAGHRRAFCKPCAFYHTKGCESGVDCLFCHLCQPGEKTRRRKERIMFRQQAQNYSQSAYPCVQTSAWRSGFGAVGTAVDVHSLSIIKPR